MEDVGLTCEAEDCAFSTPDMGTEWYPAMVTHLQVYEIKCNCIVILMLNSFVIVLGHLLRLNNIRYTQPLDMGSIWEA